jgi:hypothetical protein
MKILESAGMMKCNSSATPMEAQLKLSKKKDDEIMAYRSIIGSLRYIVNTRPDLAYSVSVVSKQRTLGCCEAYSEVPEGDHWVWLQE